MFINLPDTCAAALCLILEKGLSEYPACEDIAVACLKVLPSEFYQVSEGTICDWRGCRAIVTRKSKMPGVYDMSVSLYRFVE